MNALLEKILSQGFPAQRDEQWKYTNIQAIASRPFVLARKAVLDTVSADKMLSENYIIFINGYIALQHIADEDAQKINLNALQCNTTAQLSDDIFENLNMHFFQEGLHISITGALKHPLQILYIATEENWVQPRNAITLEANSEAVIIETFNGTAASINNSYTHIDVKANAKLGYIKMQQEHPAAFHIGRTHMTVAQNALAKTYAFSTGAKLARSDLNIQLTGEGACTELYGLYSASGRMHLDHHTLIEHAAVNTQSRELYHGILKDQSRAVFNGKVIVKSYARGTYAEQANHNLLLSSDAEIDTKPELEIYCDDVKCTHGATIGQLDENAIFYLRARGLDEASAKQLLLEAFSAKIINLIDDKILREKIWLC